MTKRRFALIAVLAVAALAFSGCDLLDGIFGPPGGLGDPVEIPDSVAADARFTGTEDSFFVNVNGVRTTYSLGTFGSRNTNLDALARRYAFANILDTHENLDDRIAEAIGSCQASGSFIFGTSAADINSNGQTWDEGITNMDNLLLNPWIAEADDPNHLTRDADWTQIGVGMVETTNPAVMGSPWYSFVVLFAKP